MRSTTASRSRVSVFAWSLSNERKRFPRCQSAVCTNLSATSSSIAACSLPSCHFELHPEQSFATGFGVATFVRPSVPLLEALVLAIGEAFVVALDRFELGFQRPQALFGLGSGRGAHRGVSSFFCAPNALSQGRAAPLEEQQLVEDVVFELGQ